MTCTVCGLAKAFAHECLGGIELPIVFAREKHWPFNGVYNRRSHSAGRLYVNIAHRRKTWWTNTEAKLEFLIHELAHHYGHHLEHAYREATCRIGARTAMLALAKP